MSKRKTQRQKAPTTWPYTPEPSPRLKATTLSLEDIPQDLNMEDPTSARTISMARKEGIYSPNRPTLDDVLNGHAPPPYTLSAYTAFLSQQHCLETLEFVTEARKYKAQYEQALPKNSDQSISSDSDMGFELVQQWIRILDVYVKPGAPREINLPAEERDDLVEYPFEPQPAPPTALEPSIKRMYDLMSDSIFIPFCNSLKVPSMAQTYGALSELSREQFEPSRMTFDERSSSARRAPTRRKPSPPNTSSTFSPSRSPPSQDRVNPSSTLSHALNRAGNNRLSTHVSHSSAASETALTDSDADETAVMTPPTTPPTSELGGHSHNAYAAPTTHPIQHKQQRSDSGAWKKTMRFFGGSNKKRDA